MDDYLKIFNLKDITFPLFIVCKALKDLTTVISSTYYSHYEYVTVIVNYVTYVTVIMNYVTVIMNHVTYVTVNLNYVTVIMNYVTSFLTM